MADDRHDYRRCADEDCPRYGCRVYREGFTGGYDTGHVTGYSEGQAAGYAEGYSGGYAAGTAVPAGR